MCWKRHILPKKSVSWLSPPLFHHRRNKDAFSVKALLGNLSPGAFFFLFFSHSIDDIPQHDHSQSLTCDHHLCSFPASLPLTRKCTSIPFFLQHATSEPALHFHSDLISSVWISPVLCCLYYCSVVPGRVCSVSKRKRNKKKRPYFFASVVSKEPQPSKRPLHFQGWQLFRQKLHPGCRDCTNPCSCTVLTI